MSNDSIEDSSKRQEVENMLTVNSNLPSLSCVSIKEKLNENIKSKSVSFEGKIEGFDSTAVILLEKTPFTDEDLKNILTSQTKLNQIFYNDIYGTYECKIPAESNAMKMTVIHPATAKHIEKFRREELAFIEETPEDYENITKPYILSRQFSIQWVYNILEHKAEADRIIVEDTDPDIGFVLVPDLKWNGENIEDMYACCVCQNRSILSIRELTKDHLPLLKNIQKKCLAAIKEKYGVMSNRIRAYFHYQPSYFHLHVHFTHIKFEAPGSGMEKGHLLSVVINNLENYPDYYEKATLSYLLRQNDELFLKFKENCGC